MTMQLPCASLATLLATFALSSALNPELFLNEDLALPKCCPKDHVYDLVNKSLKCVERPILDLVVHAPWRRQKSGDCVEVLLDAAGGGKLQVLNGTDYAEPNEYIRYPKCCPLGHAYNALEHKCVDDRNSSNVTETYGLFIKHGLGHCVATERSIVDYNQFNISKDIKAVLPDGKSFELGRYCFDKNSNTGEDVLRVCQSYTDACENNPGGRKMPCYTKCCSDGHSFFNRRCTLAFKYGLDLTKIVNGSSSAIKEDFVVIQANPRAKIRPTDPIKLDNEGNFYKYEEQEWTKYGSGDGEYCAEANENGSYEMYLFYKAEEDPIGEMRTVTNPILLIISSVFLVLTIVCYMIIPDVRNLYGKSVMMFCCVLLMSFAILIYCNFFDIDDQNICIAIGFIIMFSFLGAFSWLNVICFDMWMAFGQIRVRNMHTRKTDCKRFIYYQLYGWGVPTFFTVLAYTVWRTEVLPEEWVPHIGEGVCWFPRVAGTYDYILFYLAPQTILIGINCVLFIKTIRYCFKVKDEINRMKDAVPSEKAKKKIFSTDKEKLNMLVKLSVIMGVTWTFEILVCIVNSHSQVFRAVEFIGDTFNYLQGVFIFCIFVLKKKVLTSLKNRIFQNIVRRPSDCSTTMTSLYSTTPRNGVLMTAVRKTSDTLSTAK